MTQAVERGIHEREHTEIYAEVGAADDVATLIAKVTEDLRVVIADTRHTLDLAALEGAAATISVLRRVVLYGVGASGIARDLHLKPERSASRVPSPTTRTTCRRSRV